MRVDIRYNLRSRKKFRGLYGYQYQKGPARRVVVNLDFHAKETRRLHEGADKMVAELIRTIDHEVAHAFAPQDIDPRTARGRVEESQIMKFERAGAWARR